MVALLAEAVSAWLNAAVGSATSMENTVPLPGLSSTVLETVSPPPPAAVAP
ncbi:hypothetical protein D3C85_1788680 [compost metagenome]